MYHAKQHRRGSIEFFREELNAREIERARWAAELQQALANDELELLYQPKADVASGALTGSRRCCTGAIRSTACCRPPASCRT